MSAAATDPVVGVVDSSTTSSHHSSIHSTGAGRPTSPTPVIWAVLGWVRNVFNEGPGMNYDSATTVPGGQTITGNWRDGPRGDA